MSWALFREVHFKVICAVLVVIASMLVLQSGLNQLKFRSLVADATASSLQVVASTVETAVQRAEQVGLAVEEMTGLEDLMLREMQLNAGITLLMVVSPVGTPLVSVGGDALPEADRDAVLRRVLSSGEQLTSLDVGETLYVGRVLYDSSNNPMGSVILSTPTAEIAVAAGRTVDRLNLIYLGIFFFVAILLIPFIFIRFAPLGPVFRLLDPRAVRGEVPLAAADRKGARAIAEMIQEGNAAFERAAQEVEALATGSATSPTDAERRDA